MKESLWPAEGAAALVDALARRAGMPMRADAVSGAKDAEGACEELGLEAERVYVSAANFEEALRAAPPAVVELPEGTLALVGAGRGWVRALGPDLRVRRVDLDQVWTALSANAEAPHAAEIDELLEECRIGGERRKTARRMLLRERLGDVVIGRVIQLRVTPGASFAGQAREAGLLRQLVGYAVAHGLEYFAWLLAWWLLGVGALSGRTDRGWLTGWSLLLLTMVPLRMWMLWLQGRLALGLGGLLKQRLLAGALKLDQDQIRHQGAGQLLGRVIESETVESLALGGGLNALAAAVELAMAAAVLAVGAGGLLHAALLGVWIGFTVWMGVVFAKRRREWTEARLKLTDDLVERMTGHRTRLAQQPPEEWHKEEDRAVDEYLHRAAAMDKADARLLALASRGWLAAGLAGLASGLMSGGSEAAASLAMGLGGVLIAQRALKKLASSMAQLAGAGIAWEAVKPLFNAAAKVERPAVVTASGPSAAVIDAHDLTFRYHERGEPVLRGASVRIERGDRVLLEGESGGGKSTLASVLVGLRESGSGMLLAGGLDRKSLGSAGWRKRIVAAPQYHENHILSAPFAFNLLMGRAWPPTEEDLKEAWQVCQELGLGPLLERMPGGLQQMVGDTGWQLSQGERSRVFMARALLQRAELVVLDESFAALDPENLKQALECVLRRAPALVVVAHP